MFKSRAAFATLACLFMAIVSGSVLSQPCSAAQAVRAVYTVDETRNFKELAQATIDAIDGNKEREMVAKITDLETAWDAKEDTLKPRDPATWTALDKTLDKGISAIRGSKVDLKAGKAALQSLIQKLDQATKK